MTAYISDQAEHYRKFSYQEELRELLKRHRVAFDELLWEYCPAIGRTLSAILSGTSSQG